MNFYDNFWKMANEDDNNLKNHSDWTVGQKFKIFTDLVAEMLSYRMKLERSL